MSGQTYRDYTVKVIGSVGTQSHEEHFNLRLKNPCIDSDFVYLQAPAEEKTYVIHAEELEWRHEEFIVVTQPIEHNLCGDLTYEVTFRGFLLTPSSQPLRYQDQLRSLAFFSNDYNDIGI